MDPWSLPRAQVRSHRLKACGSLLKRPKHTQRPSLLATWEAVFYPFGLTRQPETHRASSPGSHLGTGACPGQIAQPKPLLHGLQVGEKPQKLAFSMVFLDHLPLTERLDPLNLTRWAGPLGTCASPGRMAQLMGVHWSRPICLLLCRVQSPL